MTRYEFWMPTLVSLSAIVLTFLNFRRARRFENENYIYKLKVELYAKFIGEFVKLINGLQSNVREAKLYLKEPSEETIDKVSESADQIDEIVLAFDDFLVTNSLVIPGKLLKKLNQFSEKLLNTDPIDELDEIQSKNIERLDHIVDTFINEANEIAAMFRKDIHIEKINATLFRRLK